MNLYVAVTDKRWFEFLSDLQNLDEVNFWQPGGNRRFTLLAPGAPFLFKLHSPDNFIVGGAFFAHASLLPVSLAWEAFGLKNGAASLTEMRGRLTFYRRVASDPRADYTVGCIILQDPFFFQRGDWIPVPSDFHRNIVQGKSYDMLTLAGRALWDLVQARRAAAMRTRIAEPEPPSLYGDPVLTRATSGAGDISGSCDRYVRAPLRGDSRKGPPRSGSGAREARRQRWPASHG